MNRRCVRNREVTNWWPRHAMMRHRQFVTLRVPNKHAHEIITDEENENSSGLHKRLSTAFYLFFSAMRFNEPSVEFPLRGQRPRPRLVNARPSKGRKTFLSDVRYENLPWYLMQNLHSSFTARDSPSHRERIFVLQTKTRRGTFQGGVEGGKGEGKSKKRVKKLWESLLFMPFGCATPCFATPLLSLLSIYFFSVLWVNDFFLCVCACVRECTCHPPPILFLVSDFH